MNLRLLSLATLVLSACACLVSASASAAPVVVAGQIQTNDQLRDLNLLGNDAQVNLIRKPSAASPLAPNTSASDLAALPSMYNTLVRQDGKFIFSDVAPGTYWLSIQARWHAFATYRVDVHPASPEPSSALPHSQSHSQMDNKGPNEPPSPAAAAAAAAASARARRRAASQLVKIRLVPQIALATAPGGLPGALEASLANPPLPIPFTLQPASKLEFFMEPQAFDLMGMLKSPMVLLALVGGGMVFLLPKLMVGDKTLSSLCSLPFRPSSKQARLAVMLSKWGVRRYDLLQGPFTDSVLFYFCSCVCSNAQKGELGPRVAQRTGAAASFDELQNGGHAIGRLGLTIQGRC